jgi:hypothetical protein
VTNVDSATQLALADDIFTTTNSGYMAFPHAGTNTTATAGKLIASAAAFTNGTYTIRPGDIAENITDGTTTRVVTVDSATQLTLADDIFLATGKTYLVRSLCSAVKFFIDTVRPVGPGGDAVRVLAPTIDTTNVTMTGAGTNYLQTIADITTYMNGMVPDQVLYRSQLLAIAVNNGAVNPAVSAPGDPLTPSSHHMIRPGVISVSA